MSNANADVAVTHLLDAFPKASETFILNQLVGLLDAGYDPAVIAARNPTEPVTHELFTEYGLLERTVYADQIDGYTDIVSALQGVSAVPKAWPALLSLVTERKRGAIKLGNLAAMLDTDYGETSVYHAHFGTTATEWDFVPLVTDAAFVASFYGKDVSEAMTNSGAFDKLKDRVDYVTVLSNAMAQELQDAGFNSDTIVKQPLAIDTDTFEFTPPDPAIGYDPVRISSVARLTEKKGIRYALEAIAELSESYNIDYVIAGDGPLRNDLKQRIKTLGLEDTVTLLGYVSQARVQQLLQESHLFLQPSVTAANGDKEGTPTVLLEAQATGLPVVSTYHAGIPEIVADGESGLLVPERDVDALVDAIQELLASPNEWQQMGESGREIVEATHSIPAAVERLETLYGKAQRNDE